MLHQFKCDTLLHNNKQLLLDYQTNGIVYLQDFISATVIQSLLNELHLAECQAEEDIKNNWNNEKVFFYSKNASQSQAAVSDYATTRYFQQSHDKAHVFYELTHGVSAVNRIGHGMHLHEQFNSLHHMVYHNQILNTILKMAGLIKPICQLSVYIPKHANEIGSDVRPHQESTFAYTEPQSVVVLWIALEDATIENACMWGILGSNQWPLQFVSRVDHLANTRQFEQINHDVTIPNFNTQRECFVPLEVKTGDALFFHGNFVHCSPINSSTKSRKALSLQFIETENVHYASSNWLQPRNNKFIYDTRTA